MCVLITHCTFHRDRYYLIFLLSFGVIVVAIIKHAEILFNYSPHAAAAELGRAPKLIIKSPAPRATTLLQYNNWHKSPTLN